MAVLITTRKRRCSDGSGVVYFRVIRGEYRNSIYHELVPGEWQASVIKFSGGGSKPGKECGREFSGAIESSV